jgi:RNA polymerase sigma-70 factor (ECF subfamily)
VGFAAAGPGTENEFCEFFTFCRPLRIYGQSRVNAGDPLALNRRILTKRWLKREKPVVETPEGTVADVQDVGGRRTDEWSECIVLIANKQDRAAFTRFFRHFAPLIKAFALSGSSLSASVADELVQEVMLKVWQKAGGFNPEKAAASTWVYTIARNCRTDMFRRLQKFDTPLAEEDVFPDRESEEPFALLHGRRSEERVRQLMKSLPPDQMQILAKVYMEGKSHAEAAAELDLPLGTVKSRVRLAIQKLQIQIDR